MAGLSELEVQARWFAGEFGRAFQSCDGELIEVVQFGVWNRAAGPDFTEAVVRIGSREPVKGALEIDPTHEGHGLAGVCGAEGVAGVGAVHGDRSTESRGMVNGRGKP